MQMSRERFQEVHKLIWNTVISRASEIANGETTAWFVRGLGVREAYQKGILDADEARMISLNNNCLISALYGYCGLCCLGNCNTVSSLYRRVCRGDVNAMLEIRDIVDKKPFTDLLIVTLK